MNGTAMGYGIYLAQQAATSVGYTADAASPTCRIFACRGVILVFRMLF